MRSRPSNYHAIPYFNASRSCHWAHLAVSDVKELVMMTTCHDDYLSRPVSLLVMMTHPLDSSKVVRPVHSRYREGQNGRTLDFCCSECEHFASKLSHCKLQTQFKHEGWPEKCAGPCNANTVSTKLGEFVSKTMHLVQLAIIHP